MQTMMNINHLLEHCKCLNAYLPHVNREMLSWGSTLSFSLSLGEGLQWINPVHIVDHGQLYKVTIVIATMSNAHQTELDPLLLVIASTFCK